MPKLRMAKGRLEKSATTRSREIFENLSLQEQIARAMPVARELVLPDGEPGSVIDHVGAILVDPTLGEGLTDAAYGRLADQLAAARALGIAIGVLVRPAAFTKAGAR